MATIAEQTMGATEFKAKCLDVMDRLARGEWKRVIVTKRGCPVMIAEAPPPAPATETPEERFAAIYGCMKNFTSPFPPDLDLTAPMYTEAELDAMDARFAEKFKDYL